MDREIQNYIRIAAANGRETERVGPFLATFNPHHPLKYLSYAIPDDGAEPTARDVAALIEAYRRRDRLPRLEFLPAASPPPSSEPCSRAAFRSRRGCRS